MGRNVDLGNFWKTHKNRPRKFPFSNNHGSGRLGLQENSLRTELPVHFPLHFALRLAFCLRPICLWDIGVSRGFGGEEQIHHVMLLPDGRILAKRLGSRKPKPHGPRGHSRPGDCVLLGLDHFWGLDDSRTTNKQFGLFDRSRSQQEPLELQEAYHFLSLAGMMCPNKTLEEGKSMTWQRWIAQQR